MRNPDKAAAFERFRAAVLALPGPDFQDVEEAIKRETEADAAMDALFRACGMRPPKTTFRLTGIEIPEFPTRLAEMLIERRLNQSQFARLVGVSHVAVSHWLRGVREPGARELIAIARVLGVAAESLFPA